MSAPVRPPVDPTERHLRLAAVVGTAAAWAVIALVIWQRGVPT